MGRFSIVREAGILVFALGLSAASSATSLSFNGTVLMGVNGVQVGSTAYDVTFGDQALISGELFTSPTDNTAVTALFDALTNEYRISPYQITSINGCTGACTAVVMSSSPYQTIYNYASHLSFVPRPGGAPSYLATLNFAILPNTDMGSQPNETWTHWKVETTPVTPIPEPATYAMLISGLGLIGLIARRRKTQQAA